MTTLKTACFPFSLAGATGALDRAKAMGLTDEYTVGVFNQTGKLSS